MTVINSFLFEGLKLKIWTIFKKLSLILSDVKDWTNGIIKPIPAASSIIVIKENTNKIFRDITCLLVKILLIFSIMLKFKFSQSSAL